ncbi:cell envelope integrity protein TolA [Massilia sp. ST3]|uniref:cell envelope integrity protein TolA n=1 Tax=Massilia sp. ST3 TaxID=2824903 RepID=UPI001B82625F|nr:cell envelope integrity protein TolA [Massilia sp. ST3]MBQ5948742.1 cell envelope integrity protein TolA [Massilia sp. ST3]
MKPASAGTPYYVPPEPKRLPSFVLALVVHAVLLSFLWFGISWQSNEPVAVEAEVWDMSVQTAAAPPLPADPPPPPPKPEPQPVQRAEPPPPVERPAPTPPDIALEREKQRKADELKKKELAEKREREREKEIAEQKKKDELEKKKQEEAERKELAKKEADEKKKKEDAKKLADAKKAAAEKARLDKIRQEDLKRMAGAMGSGGTAEKSTAPKIDSGYVAAITAKIKSNTTYAGGTDVPGNPKAVFKVDQLPTGEIMSVRLSKSSGVPEFDRAVENGIRKASPLPKKKDGTVERNLEVNFSMKDLD